MQTLSEQLEGALFEQGDGDSAVQKFVSDEKHREELANDMATALSAKAKSIAKNVVMDKKKLVQAVTRAIRVSGVAGMAEPLAKKFVGDALADAMAESVWGDFSMDRRKPKEGKRDAVANVIMFVVDKIRSLADMSSKDVAAILGVEAPEDEEAGGEEA